VASVLTRLRVAMAELALWRKLRPPLAAGWQEGLFPMALRGGPFRRQRKYFLYIPAAVSRRDRLPLLVMLHGCSQNAHAFAAGTRMNALADRYRFIVLYPEQSLGANPLRCWNWFAAATHHGGGDAAAIAALVRDVTRLYPVDRARVYVVGLSAGGALTAILALYHGALFAACAIVAGLMYGAADSALGAMRAMRSGSSRSPEAAAAQAAGSGSRKLRFVPALVMQGDRDTVVDPRNAEQIVAQFRRFAELVGVASALPEPVEQYIRGEGRNYRQRDYRRGDALLLRAILIEGLDHAWSGGDARHAYNDAGQPDASRLIWEFLAQFRRPPRWRWTRLRRWLQSVRRLMQSS
jgi:poly(hydroxyalkanoate) depolymerase family esterase